MKEADEKNGIWRTIGGRRIFIRKGENLTDAMKRSGKFKIHGPNDPKIKKANKPYEKEDAKRAKQYEKDQELRKIIQKNEKELRKRLEQMKKSGEFKEILGEPGPTEKSIKALNEIDKLADNKDDLKESDNNRKIKIGSKVYWIGAGNEISSEGKVIDFPVDDRMTIKWDDNEQNTYDITHPNIILADNYDNSVNELKAKYMALPEDKRVSAYAHGENWKDLVKRAYSLDEKETNALHNHLESNIKSWREQGMSDKQILDMVSDRVKVSRDDGLYDIKGLDMRLKKEAILDEYQNYIQNKISTKTKSDYDKDLRNISSKAEGTYDLSTGNPKSYQDGYQVTFSMTNMGFDDNTYKSLIEKFKTHDHGTVDAGNFDGYSEVSFNVTDIKKAAKLATKYNQVSIWDWKNGKVIPTKGTGKYEDYKPESVSDKIKSQRKGKK